MARVPNADQHVHGLCVTTTVELAPRDLWVKGRPSPAAQTTNTTSRLGNSFTGSDPSVIAILRVPWGADHRGPPSVHSQKKQSGAVAQCLGGACWGGAGDCPGRAGSPVYAGTRSAGKSGAPLSPPRARYPRLARRAVHPPVAGGSTAGHAAALRTPTLALGLILY
jgi:hypothetical protein